MLTEYHYDLKNAPIFYQNVYKYMWWNLFRDPYLILDLILWEIK